MSSYENYLCLPYIAGQQDCYSLLRNYCADVYGLKLPNYARPDRFWEDPNLDLYGRFREHGFVEIMDGHIEIGDALLMQIRTPINSHAALVVADNLVLHHLPGQLSSVDRMRPRYTTLANVILRHPTITEFHRPPQPPRHFHEVLADARILQNPAVEARVGIEMAARD